FDPQPLHALQLYVLRTDYVIVHSACVNVTPTARTLPLCAVAGTLEFMSNSRLRDCNLQSGAVLWLRHSFAHAFSGDSEVRL
ncbi:MAG: hypothetical protein K2N54_07235, partial [Helicobacter sp.]|nr:hypothetical protein [Helicobacter sp.]